MELVSGPQELWRFGSQDRAIRGTPLMLFATVLGDAAALRYSTPRRQGTAAGYSVTAGKTLLITRLLYSADATKKRFALGYSDTDRGMNNAADGANPVNLDTPTADGLGVIIAVNADTLYDVNVYYEIPAGKFPRIVAAVGVANLYIQHFGVEV